MPPKNRANRFSPFAPGKGQARVDAGRRYAFGKVEQVSERGSLWVTSAWLPCALRNWDVKKNRREVREFPEMGFLGAPPAAARGPPAGGMESFVRSSGLKRVPSARHEAMCESSRKKRPTGGNLLAKLQALSL